MAKTTRSATSGSPSGGHTPAAGTKALHQLPFKRTVSLPCASTCVPGPPLLPMLPIS